VARCRIIDLGSKSRYDAVCAFLSPELPQTSIDREIIAQRLSKPAKKAGLEAERESETKSRENLFSKKAGR
jgi:hypothetical protein